MILRSSLLVAVSAASCLAAGSASAAGLLYTLESSVTLPSTDTGWDYIKMEPKTNRLFMARDKDGLTLFDVDAGKAVSTIGNSTGANGPLLLPQYNRGYVAMTDGSFLSFDLKTLKPIDRLKLDSNGGINSAIHDPLTKQVHAIVGTRPKESTWYTLDAATGKLLKTTTFPFRKMDDPATDGKGRLFAPARRDGLILTLDSKTLQEKARWTAPCNVSKVRFQASTNRILAACGGDKPMFFAVNPDTGAVVAQVPIGRGIDGFGIDEQRKRIVTSNGTDGTLTVIGQGGPDSYALLGTVSTSLGARMMTMDERNGKLYVVNATYTESAPDASGSTNETYHPNSFVVMTFKPE